MRALAQVRRRVPRQAHTPVPAATTLAPAAIEPSANQVLDLCLAAMHHKSGTLRNAALGTMSNLVYFLPRRVIRAALERFWEAMEAANSVHQISMSIRWIASALPAPLQLATCVQRRVGDAHWGHARLCCCTEQSVCIIGMGRRASSL